MTRYSEISSFISDRFEAVPADTALALVFPGQGSQRVGMAAEIPTRSAIGRRVIETAEDILGSGMVRLCFDGPEEELTRTSNAQPAILTASVAILATALESGVLRSRPELVAGHSVGEYAALVVAGALDFEDALALVRERGSLMEKAATDRPGTMAAIVGVDAATVSGICTQTGAEACNYNSPTQIVVGGAARNVEAACRLAKEKGGRGLPLNVSGAFHTSFMKSAAAEFAKALDEHPISDPAIPVVGNVTATALTTASDVREDIARQIGEPVRWSQSMDLMIERGIRRVVEVGPGRTLTAVIKRSYPLLQAISIDSAEALSAPSNV